MTKAESPWVRVGVSVFVRNKEGKYLFGKRKNSHGEGTWANPGGHLDFGESIEDCARREVLEETGINVGSVRFLAITNDIFTIESRHYVTIHMIAESLDEEAHLREPLKVSEWRWFENSEWPRPLFLTIENLLASNPALLTAQFPE